MGGQSAYDSKKREFESRKPNKPRPESAVGEAGTDESRPKGRKRTKVRAVQEPVDEDSLISINTTLWVSPDNCSNPLRKKASVPKTAGNVNADFVLDLVTRTNDSVTIQRLNVPGKDHGPNKRGHPALSSIRHVANASALPTILSAWNQRLEEEREVVDLILLMPSMDPYNVFFGLSVMSNGLNGFTKHQKTGRLPALIFVDPLHPTKWAPPAANKLGDARIDWVVDPTFDPSKADLSMTLIWDFGYFTLNQPPPGIQYYSTSVEPSAGSSGGSVKNSRNEEECKVSIVPGDTPTQERVKFKYDDAAEWCTARASYIWKATKCSHRYIFTYTASHWRIVFGRVNTNERLILCPDAFPTSGPNMPYASTNTMRTTVGGTQKRAFALAPPGMPVSEDEDFDDKGKGKEERCDPWKTLSLSDLATIAVVEHEPPTRTYCEADFLPADPVGPSIVVEWDEDEDEEDDESGPSTRGGEMPSGPRLSLIHI